MSKNSKLLILLLIAVSVLNCSTVMAADYNFSTTYEDDTFANPTTSDIPPDYSHIQNVRVDKNAAYFPPSYGIFSGEFDTEPTSKYHTQDRYDATVTSYNNVQYFDDDVTAGYYAPTSNMLTEVEESNINNNGSSNIYMSYDEPEQTVTTVKEKSDGSIGRISIPELELDVRVYEGTTNSIMSKGVGHFTYTSQWHGNVGLASHNRGNASYFNGIWNLDYGDEIVYSTSAGTRTYYVVSVDKVDVDDTSSLSSTSNNQLTLITCVANQSSKRWCVVARER